MTDAAAGVPAAMDAWRQNRYGGPEAVRIERVAVPVPGPADVLLRVRATSINSGDVKVMRGVPLLIRPVSGLRRPRIATRGIDIAGTVAAIGSEVRAFAIGDEVMGEIAGGALAEYVVAPAGMLTDAAQLPDASFDAVVDMAGRTPLRALRRLVRPPGTLVLVSGEGGRVGGPIGRILRGILLSHTPGPRVRPLAAAAKPEVTRELAALAAAGGIRPVVERTFAFADARAALAHVDAGHTLGKVVVDVP